MLAFLKKVNSGVVLGLAREKEVWHLIRAGFGADCSQEDGLHAPAARGICDFGLLLSAKGDWRRGAQ